MYSNGSLHEAIGELFPLEDGRSAKQRYQLRVSVRWRHRALSTL